jgi:SAM-dependent methyltransferase
MDRRAHWNEAWTTRSAESVSWYQSEPEPSLQLVKSVTSPGDAVIDIGGGASGLAGALAAEGYLEVTVLDVSGAALNALKARLGDRAARVRTIEADVLDYPFDSRKVALWHDRAAFHFLTEPSERARYRAQLGLAVRSGGYAVVGTFAPDAPPRCSGLAVQRYDGVELARELGANWRVVEVLRHEHHTPSGVVQPFTFLVARHFPD